MIEASATDQLGGRPSGETGQGNGDREDCRED